jgi:hypothetical protein
MSRSFGEPPMLTASFSTPWFKPAGIGPGTVP